MNTAVLPTAEALADAFCLEVAEALTAWELADAILRNAAEPPDSGICHTHDHHDANVLMESAWESVAGVELDAGDDSHASLWNNAWDRARLSHFGKSLPWAVENKS